MLKTVLLASSMLIAAPAFAQEKPPADTSAQQQTPPADDATTTADDAAPGDMATDPVATPNPDPATEAAQPTPTPSPTPTPAPEAAPSPEPSTEPKTAAAQPAETPAANQSQVAEAVNRDFGTYDKDADGKLSQTEFGDWMNTLRKASEPTFVPGSPEATAWIGQAFAASDADQSASVDPAELTTFLTPKPS